MDSSVISGLIGGLAAVVIGSFVSSKVRDAADEGELRFGTSIILLGWCCLAISAFAGIVFLLMMTYGQTEANCIL